MTARTFVSPPANVSLGSKTDVGARNPKVRSAPKSRLHRAIRRRPLSADIVAKVFSGWRTKILRAADASSARRREGPNRFIQNRSRDLRSGVEKRRSSGEVQRSTFARFLGLFDFRLLQQYLPIAEVTSTYSITSSARARSDGGTSIPSDFAVLRLMASKNLVGCSIGSSAGLAPLRIRSI